MNQKRLMREISAHIDGEAKRPVDVARMLQKNPDAAKRCMELAKVSAHVQALPKPEADPLFTTRVVQSAAALRPARPRWVSIGVPALAAAAVVLIAGGYLALTGVATTRQRIYWANDGGVTLSAGDEEILLAEIARRVAWGETVAPFGALDYNDAVQFSTEDMLLALGSASWFDELADEVGADLDTAIGLLDTAETETFKALLRDYAREG